MDHLSLQEREFHFTKSVKAPLERVFNAWTDETMLSKWWGPEDFTNPKCSFDPNPEGEIYIEMTGPDNRKYPMVGTVFEVTPSTALIFNSNALSEKNEILISALNTVTFTSENEQTLIDLSVQVKKAAPEAKELLDGMEAGWTQSLERLERVLLDIELNSLN